MATQTENGAKHHSRQAPQLPSAAGAKRRWRQAPLAPRPTYMRQTPQAPSGAAWFPTRSSWPERSEGHERSPAGAYIYVFDHPEGKVTDVCMRAAGRQRARCERSEAAGDR